MRARGDQIAAGHAHGADARGRSGMSMPSLLGRLLVGVLACASNTASADAIDDYIQAEMQQQQIPGLALGIVRDGALVRAQGYGYANLEHRVPVHVDTVFQSGSIGKQFTAVAVMLMVEDGKLALDASIHDYLPEAPPSWAAITTRQLLNHTSGLHGDPGLDLRRDYSDAELLKALLGVPQDFPPGQRWRYSNTGYVLLGLLVGRVGGAPYMDVLRQRVFAPLQMSTAGPIDESGIVPNRAAGYELGVNGALVNQAWVSPTANSTADGALYLTVLDYAKWESAVRAGAILDKASWAEVFRPAVLNSGRTYPYGFGWHLIEHGGQVRQEHGGIWQGFRTYYTRFPDKGVAVVVLANGAGAQPKVLAQGIAARFDGGLAAPPARAITDDDPEVTARLRRILSAPALSADEQARFANPQYLGQIDAYRQRRAPLGRLQSLQLFGVDQRGDERFLHYRARFSNGASDVLFAVDQQPTDAGPGGIMRLILLPVAHWDDPAPDL